MAEHYGYLNTKIVLALCPEAEVLIVSRVWKESKEMASGNDLMNELTSCYIYAIHMCITLITKQKIRSTKR